MIELTEQQVASIAAGESPPHAVDPLSKRTYVLLPLEEYAQLHAWAEGGWTREELHAQAWEAGLSHGWEGMDEYDDLPAKP